jgi:hypothetical protein
MPCKPRMAGCRRGCLHRRLVFDYRNARQAAEALRGELTLGYAAEAKIAEAELGPIEPTFKQWIVGHRQEEPER